MKRKQNKPAVKFKFLSAENNKPQRISVTQTNSKKRITISNNSNFESLDFIFSLFEKCESIEDYNLIIDNTQNDYYLVSFDNGSASIFNFIEWIKNNKPFFNKCSQ